MCALALDARLGRDDFVGLVVLSFLMQIKESVDITLVYEDDKTNKAHKVFFYIYYHI